MSTYRKEILPTAGSVGPIRSKIDRATSKPLMEKRRRERINKSLNELKSILLEAYRRDSASCSKLEKADILEMSVRYIHSLKTPSGYPFPGAVLPAHAQPKPQPQAASELSRVLATCPEISEESKRKILGSISPNSSAPRVPLPAPQKPAPQNPLNLPTQQQIAFQQQLLAAQLAQYAAAQSLAVSQKAPSIPRSDSLSSGVSSDEDSNSDVNSLSSFPSSLPENKAPEAAIPQASTSPIFRPW
ncbi:Oidioi.mRNA.OKI2018_I69.PAR.g9817.t1.cds [Oikopleura dioica]|uniref:Oidioi.mRNA.OKI2018_I69.PAR.g9817.t1.cds n=1 Tax=Oikopleura dioica TaxID=34765 RepID=A0ABN7RMI1_OIKDI|nr:Oidioi.mRNA.OKI2018_I69.PAR.g9817.t1.cds [Oikopleura dioica]